MGGGSREAEGTVPGQARALACCWPTPLPPSHSSPPAPSGLSGSHGLPHCPSPAPPLSGALSLIQYHPFQGIVWSLGDTGGLIRPRHSLLHTTAQQSF